jgi:hypothetical protein
MRYRDRRRKLLRHEIISRCYVFTGLADHTAKVKCRVGAHSSKLNPMIPYYHLGASRALGMIRNPPSEVAI